MTRKSGSQERNSECRGLLGSTLGSDTCNGLREAALDRGRSSNRGLSQAHRELGSWEALPSMAPVEARGMGLCAPTSILRNLGRGSSLQLRTIPGERRSCPLTIVLAVEGRNA